jgi:tyrosinase
MGALMISRRRFIKASATAIASPIITSTFAFSQATRVRRDVTTMTVTDPFFAKYASAVRRMHELPSGDRRNWRNQALIHINHCPHGTQDFTHWHRHYIANFEAICGELIGDQTFALPYWNWSNNSGRIPDAFYDLNELSVAFWKDPANASSSNWPSGQVTTVGARNLAKGQGLQEDPLRGGSFAQSSIDTIQRLTNYGVYVRRLEGSPHNNAHVLTGGMSGHMGNGMSPLDPIFWLHHCNVDRLWALWQAAGNSTPPLARSYAGQFANGAGQPVTTATSANALDISSFGYTYDDLSGPLVETLSRRLDLRPVASQTVVNDQAVRTALQTLGSDANKQTVPLRVETRFAVNTPNLISSLFQPRAYWAPDVLGVRRIAIEPGRIVAKLANVQGPKDNAPIIVNVFVNCPYLSSETAYTDLHFAGSFSFFGAHHHSDYYVDITEPLKKLASEGRIATDQVNVQLMPQPVGDVRADTTFTVGSVDLLSA